MTPCKALAVCITLAWLAALTPSACRAQSILIAPGSLVLTNAQRTGEISVANTEDRILSYRVEPALFRMRSDGFLDEVETLDRDATPLVRFAPRQFDLGPGESQVIRVAFRAPSDLPPGEYRMHLRMRNMGVPVVAGDTATASDPVVPGEISLRIPVTVARAVRVLVRHGVGPGAVGVDAMQVSRLSSDTLQVELSLLNGFSGGSANGRMEFVVDERLPAPGEPELRRRYSVYADLDRRDYRITLPVTPGAPGKVCVTLVRDEPAAIALPGDRRCESA